MRARLQKILAASGLCSRRSAEELLYAGRVRVNGVVAQVGDSADPDRDQIFVDGKLLAAPEPPSFWILHKPRGVITTTQDERGRRTILELLPDVHERLFPVGRLDRDSEGLVLLTNQGDIAQVLLHPSYESEKEYRVTVRGRLSSEACQKLVSGIVLEDGQTAPARLGEVSFDEQRDTTKFFLVLREGKNRQIRRMLEALNYSVVRLVRTRIGPIELKGLGLGRARQLSKAESRRLLQYASLRASTEKPKRAATEKSKRDAGAASRRVAVQKKRRAHRAPNVQE